MPHGLGVGSGQHVSSASSVDLMSTRVSDVTAFQVDQSSIEHMAIRFAIIESMPQVQDKMPFDPAQQRPDRP